MREKRRVLGVGKYSDIAGIHTVGEVAFVVNADVKHSSVHEEIVSLRVEFNSSQSHEDSICHPLQPSVA
jgi:hypothetical protein